MAPQKACCNGLHSMTTQRTVIKTRGGGSAVKCFLLKHEDSSLDFRYPHTNPVWGVRSVLWRRRQVDGSLEFTGQLVLSFGEFQFQWETPFQKVRWRATEGTPDTDPCLPDAHEYTYRNVYAHIHMHTHTLKEPRQKNRHGICKELP